MRVLRIYFTQLSPTQMKTMILRTIRTEANHLCDEKNIKKQISIYYVQTKGFVGKWKWSFNGVFATRVLRTMGNVYD